MAEQQGSSVVEQPATEPKTGQSDGAPQGGSGQEPAGNGAANPTETVESLKARIEETERKYRDLQTTHKGVVKERERYADLLPADVLAKVERVKPRFRQDLNEYLGELDRELGKAEAEQNKSAATVGEVKSLVAAEILQRQNPVGERFFTAALSSVPESERGDVAQLAFSRLISAGVVDGQGNWLHTDRDLIQTLVTAAAERLGVAKPRPADPLAPSKQEAERAAAGPKETPGAPASARGDIKKTLRDQLAQAAKTGDREGLAILANKWLETTSPGP